MPHCTLSISCVLPYKFMQVLLLIPCCFSNYKLNILKLLTLCMTYHIVLWLPLFLWNHMSQFESRALCVNSLNAKICIFILLSTGKLGNELIK